MKQFRSFSITAIISRNISQVRLVPQGIFPEAHAENKLSLHAYLINGSGHDSGIFNKISTHFIDSVRGGFIKASSDFGEIFWYIGCLVVFCNLVDLSGGSNKDEC